MTKREAKKFVDSLSETSGPGYILNLTRVQLENLVYDLTEIELEQFTGSNAKRLLSLLTIHPDEVTQPLVDELIKLKEN